MAVNTLVNACHLIRNVAVCNQKSITPKAKHASNSDVTPAEMNIFNCVSSCKGLLQS